jgi:predicted DNA-binding transcriptional regulator AlpA
MNILSDGLPEKGRVRCSQILDAVDISRTHFHHLVKERSVPKYAISPRVVTYDVADIRRLILNHEAV